MLQEEEFQPRALAVLAKHSDSRNSSATPRTTGTACSTAQKRSSERRGCGSVERPPANTQGEADFFVAVQALSRCSRKPNVIDLGIRAPRTGTRDGVLNCAAGCKSQICAKLPVSSKANGDASQYSCASNRRAAAGDIARNVAHAPVVDNPTRQRVSSTSGSDSDRHPVELVIMPH